ncbi:hypothetical protein OOU_Y34scaffold00707g43 [Pyricularia oryzae Y34]|uniref:Uncharacterized protein n=2 Tax=Pyricularia oryzae TaxID=318829 RepID=A0AA97NSH0_PYRO3|nr:hypothetical protein OOU_Y34scaffold00707g43 [Pyricularia oryzae Y34]
MAHAGKKPSSKKPKTEHSRQVDLSTSATP